MYVCVIAFGIICQYSGWLCTSDDLKVANKTAAPSAVQLNIVGRDGSVGPPLFITPQKL